jgi:hypothetical protein
MLVWALVLLVSRARSIWQQGLARTRSADTGKR